MRKARLRPSDALFAANAAELKAFADDRLVDL
jgi:hypothetical protein